MKAHLPDFELDVDYRALHPTKEGDCRYRFVTLLTPLFIVDGLDCGGRIISFRDKNHHEWLRMSDSVITISGGYAWNGCTPKRYSRVLRRWIGTPDFKATIPASLVHDALYQFSHCRDFPLHRSDCDEIFRQLIVKSGSPKIAETYHWAVRKFGKWDGHPSDQGEYSVIL